jgi:uncharacterized protein YyaL (SSP411 family)
MLYDNAQLARVYLHAWQVTGHEFFRTITEEILDYVVREMLDPVGGYYSTQDADSEGEEGKFFVWTPDEVRQVLGSDADECMAAYGVQPGGNWEGKNILESVGDINQRAALAEAVESYSKLVSSGCIDERQQAEGQQLDADPPTDSTDASSPYHRSA